MGLSSRSIGAVPCPAAPFCSILSQTYEAMETCEHASGSELPDLTGAMTAPPPGASPARSARALATAFGLALLVATSAAMAEIPTNQPIDTSGKDRKST